MNIVLLESLAVSDEVLNSHIQPVHFRLSKK